VDVDWIHPAQNTTNDRLFVNTEMSDKTPTHELFIQNYISLAC